MDLVTDSYNAYPTGSFLTELSSSNLFADIEAGVQALISNAG